MIEGKTTEALEVEYAGTQDAMDAAIGRAIMDGLEVVEGTGDTLLLDLDDGKELDQDILKTIAEQFGGYYCEVWRSRSGKGKHVRIVFTDRKTQPFTPAQAMALECALGSDPRRTVFGVRRLQEGVVQPRMLFKPRLNGSAPAFEEPSLLDGFDEEPF